ncbi:MAG: TetR/AcrR family transcriptional regulator [Actinomycetota bacterium]
MPALDLTPDDIVDVARDLIAAEGLDRFSMRRLAAALDVNPMTIYLRFENKGALLDAVAAASLAEFEAPVGTGTWSEQVLELASGLRRHLIADRDTLRLVGDGDRLSAGLLGTLDRGLELMAEVYPAPADAVDAFRVLFWHVVGSAFVADALETMPGSRGGLDTALADAGDAYPHLVAHAAHFGPVDGDELFLRTTTELIAGLQAGRETTT